MAPTSDINIDASKFHPDSIPQQIKEVNNVIREQTLANPKWWEVGAPKYREMRLNGETPLPKPVILDGSAFDIPSRDAGRKIPCRIMKPDNGQYSHLVMHIHGGGWVLMTEKAYDPLLKTYANGASALVISIGYRLAPENPFPAGPNDCRDAADWLVDNAQKEFGVSLQFITGDSAGGHLTMISYLHLATTHPSYTLSGLIPLYGSFDLTRTPSGYNFSDTLILTPEIMEQYIRVILPGASLDELKHPSNSPLYADLPALRPKGITLPPALFVCGTEDMLVDDTVFMAAKWQMAGGEQEARFVPGAAHGFMSLPRNKVKETREAQDGVIAWMNARKK